MSRKSSERWTPTRCVTPGTDLRSPWMCREGPAVHPRRSPTRATVPRSAGRGSSVRVLPTAGHKRHRAHLPQAPARTRSPLATTGTPCRLPCRWPAGAAAGPTGRSARGTAAPAPRRASASECPRSRRRSGHCLRRDDADTLLQCPRLRCTLGGGQAPSPVDVAAPVSTSRTVPPPRLRAHKGGFGGFYSPQNT